MPTETVQPFDDPKLKAALRRSFGAETAPAGLRQRVVAALDAATPATPTMRLTEPMQAAPRQAKSQRPMLLRSPMLGLALAAMVVIVVSMAAKYYLQSTATPPPMAMLPQSFADGMAKAHDESVAALTPDLPPLALAEMKTKAKQLGGPINNLQALAPDLGKEWSPRDVKETTIDGVKTVQVTYTRGNNALSLFSVWTKKVYSAQDGSTYEQEADKHAIAGFVRNGTTYCAVGDRGVGKDEVKKLATTIRDAPPGP